MLPPDGLGILFDQVLNSNSELTAAQSGKESPDVITSRMWLLIPPFDRTSTHQLEQLPFVGFHPQWLP